MKYLLAVFLLSSFAAGARAQITLTEQDFLSESVYGQNTFDWLDTTGGTALELLSGAGVTWHFDGHADSAGTASNPTSLLTYPGGAAEASSFPTATNVLEVVGSGGLIEYLFVQISATGMWELGASEDSAGTAFVAAMYQPAIQLSAFPLTYGTTWQSSSAINAPGLPPGASDSESVTAVVDGYGTLITGGQSTPQSTPALRVKEEYTSSISESFAGMTYSFSSRSYEFDWYTQSGYGADISSDSALDPEFVSFSTSSSSIVASQPPLQDEPMTVRLSNNPASNAETNLSFTIQSDGAVQISIIDALGRSVLMLENGFEPAGEHSVPIDAKSLVAGTYFVRLQAANGASAMQKLVIQ